MLEIGILVFILLAVGYWATLWIMGRREDVLHGQFVASEGEDELANPAPVSQLPPVPARPKHAPVSMPPVASATAPDGEALQSLLASIKQELKNAAKI